MVRKRDVIKHELRAYIGLKSIRGWEQYGDWKLRGLSTEQIWDKLQEEFEKRKEVSAKRIQRAFRKRALRAKRVTTRSFEDVGVFDDCNSFRVGIFERRDISSLDALLGIRESQLICPVGHR